jgi:cell wall-associated NlpC family hydrolase
VPHEKTPYSWGFAGCSGFAQQAFKLLGEIKIHDGLREIFAGFCNSGSV